MFIKNYGRMIEVVSESIRNERISITDAYICLETPDSTEKIYVTWIELSEILKERYPEWRTCYPPHNFDVDEDEMKPVKFLAVGKLDPDQKSPVDVLIEDMSSRLDPESPHYKGLLCGIGIIEKHRAALEPKALRFRIESVSKTKRPDFFGARAVLIGASLPWFFQLYVESGTFEDAAEELTERVTSECRILGVPCVFEEAPDG